MTKAKWNYSGDINLENGGLFWREDGADDYVLAVRVTPCSDAGGPNNLFAVDVGSVYLPDDERRSLALACCGWIEHAGMTSRGQLVEAMVAYSGIDGADMTTIRIGKHEECRDGWSPAPHTILRSDASLDRYIRNHFLN